MKTTSYLRVMLSILIAVVGFIPQGSLFAQSSTGSQTPGAWGSSINIQNIGTGNATVIITFYDANGNSALSFNASPVIPAGGSRSYYVPSAMSSLASGQYAVAISSDQPVVAVANATSTGYVAARSYSGVQTSGATGIGKTLYFPGLYKGYFGYTSEIVLQNTEASAATDVQITFYNQTTGGQVAQISNQQIPANSSRVFALDSITSVPSGNANGLLSAVVTTSQRNLAGVANVWTTSGGNRSSSYNAYSQGSTTISAPALYNNYFKFNSALTVMNIDPAQTANILVTYSNGITTTRALQPFQSVEYYQPSNTSLPSGNSTGVFAAKVESLNSVNLVGLVSVNDGKVFDSYNPIGQSSSNGINCPVVLKSYFGYFSAQTVQNVGASATDIVISYASGQSKTFTNVQPNATVNILELATTGSALPDGSSVSAIITSTTSQPLVAVVQQNLIAGNTGDSLLAYACIAR